MLLKIAFLILCVCIELNWAARPNVSGMLSDEFDMLCYMHDPYYRTFCANRGTCLVKIKKSEYDQYGHNSKLFARVMRSKAFCSCIPGFGGKRCEMQVDTGPIIINPNTALSVLIEATRNPRRYRAISSGVARNACPVKTCNKTCQFGYKMDYRTKCSVCECLDLELTECGVPCHMPNTDSCLAPQRANSRPICVCKPGFDGSQCERYQQVYNYSVKIPHVNNENKTIKSEEIKSALIEAISRELNIGTNQVLVYEAKNVSDGVIVKLGLKATPFANTSSFVNTVDVLYKKLNKRAISLEVNNTKFDLIEYCDKHLETFVYESNEKLSNQSQTVLLKNLKTKLVSQYYFNADSISVLNFKTEPTVRVDFEILNNPKQADFCQRAFRLQNDIVSKNFNLSGVWMKLLSEMEEITTTITTETTTDTTSAEATTGTTSASTTTTSITDTTTITSTATTTTTSAIAVSAAAAVVNEQETTVAVSSSVATHSGDKV